MTIAHDDEVADAPGSKVVRSVLVSEPIDALELASAALFTQGADGSYKREKSIGWPDDRANRLELDDAVVLHLRSHLSAFKLSEVHWPRQDLPRENADPVWRCLSSFAIR